MYRSRVGCLSLNEMLWVRFAHVCMSFVQLGFDANKCHISCCMLLKMHYTWFQNVCKSTRCLHHEHVWILYCCIYFNVFTEHVCVYPIVMTSFAHRDAPFLSVFIRFYPKLAQYLLHLESSRNTRCLIVWDAVTSHFNLCYLHFV